MDQYQRAFYRMQFEVAFLRAKGEAFQGLFRRIMEFAYPEDFIAVRPYGKIGDEKCDGYQHSTSTVFQCYAPKEIKLNLLLKKMKYDYEGARKQWVYMKNWIFVHNDDQGLPTPALKLLKELDNDLFINRCHWSFNELLCIVNKLNLEQLATIFGYAPTQAQISVISDNDIAAAVYGIQRFEPGVSLDPPIAPSTAKLTGNGFSTHVIELIRGGMFGAGRVREFFDRYPAPSFGETVAEAFRRKHADLSAQGLSADQRYDMLFQFAGGEHGGAPQRAAVSAVLSYFFERCDIFEEPVEGLATLE